ARVRDNAGGHREPELLSLAIEVRELRAGLHSGGACLGIDPDPLHRAQIDDDSVVADREPGEAVASAADRDRKAGLARKANCGPDVADAGAPRDQRREAADRAVPDPAVLVVSGIDRTKNLTAERASEFVDGCRVELDGGGDRGHG